MRLILVGTQGHVDPDRALIEQIMDDKVHYVRNKLDLLIKRFAFGISHGQIFADGVRPSEDHDMLAVEMAYLLEVGVVHRVDFIVYRHQHHWPGEHLEDQLICPCQPEAVICKLYMHEQNLRYLDAVKVFQQKATWV